MFSVDSTSNNAKLSVMEYSIKSVSDYYTIRLIVVVVVVLGAKNQFVSSVYCKGNEK